MHNLSPKQIKKLERLAKIADKGEIAIVEELDAISDQFEALDEKLEGALAIASEANNREIPEPIEGKKGDKGDKGDAGKDGLNGKDGLDGKDGVDGKDGKDGKNGKDGKAPLVGWGAHPLRVESGGVVKTKVARTLNFVGATVTQTASGVTDVDIQTSLDLQSVTDIGATTTNDIEAQSFVTTGGTSTQFVKGDGSLDSSAYITSSALSGLVPYTGATADVDLGTFKITSDQSFTKNQSIYNGGLTYHYSDIGVTFLGAFGASIANVYQFFNPSGFHSYFDYTGLTAAQTYSFPDATGTVALQGDPLSNFWNDVGYINSVSGQNHNSLSNLTTGDVHTQYTLLAGRSGGQIIRGGTGTTDDLILRTTSGVGASGADMIFQGGNNGATEFARFLNNGDFGIGVTNSGAKLQIDTGATGKKGQIVKAFSGQTANLLEFQNSSATVMTSVGSGGNISVNTVQTADRINVGGLVTTYGDGNGFAMYNLGANYTGNFEMARFMPVSNLFLFQTLQGGTGVGRDLRFVAGNATFHLTNSSGSVGIGTTSPSARLHAVATTEQLRVGYDTSNYWNATTSIAGLNTFDAVGSSAGFRFSKNVGIGTNPLTTSALNISRTTTTNFEASVNMVTSNTLAVGNQNYYNLFNVSNWNPSGNIFGTNVTAFYNQIRVNTANNISGGAANANQSGVALYAGGTLAAATSYYSRSGFESGAGVMTNLYHFFADAPYQAGTGTIGTAYGLYIGKQKQSFVTTGYGIYQADTADINYFGGNVGVKQTVPNSTLDVAGSFQCDSITNDTGLAHGTYTPTLTGVANVASSTPRLATYMRVGNTVTVAGQMDITPTANNTQTRIRISLPIASNFSTAYQAGGNASTIPNSAGTAHSGGIIADATNDTVEMDYYEHNGIADTFSYTFTYQVI